MIETNDSTGEERNTKNKDELPYLREEFNVKSISEG